MEIKKQSRRTGVERERGNAYILRYLLSLVFGWGFATMLIVTIGAVVGGIAQGLVGDVDYARDSFAMMITALVVFGATHLALAFSVGGKVKLNEKAEKYTKVMNAIYSIGLIGAATGFAMVALYPLFGWMMGLTNFEFREVMTLVSVGTIATILLVAMTIYQTSLIRKLPRWIYATVMGAIAVIAIVLFLIIPAKNMRDGMKDQKIVDDLMILSMEISNYASEHQRLPESLEGLNTEGMSRSLSKYEFKPGEGGYDYLTYTLCTSGFLTDMSRYGDGEFWTHKDGRDCFDETVYLGGWGWDDEEGEETYCEKDGFSVMCLELDT